jgi:quinol monooxygenase YgiN
MYGLIVKITAAPGQRQALATILLESTAGMPGCFSYIIANDAADENTIWVTEVWDSKGSHDASLSVPTVKDAIGRARPLVAGFSQVAVTAPVGGQGLPSRNTGA